MKLKICLMVFLCLCILSFSRADTLGRQLYILGGKLEGFETDQKKLEQEYLNLLNQYDDPKDIGRIYAALTDMYCQSGISRDPFSATKYAQKALEYPLAPPIKIRLHCNWGDALQMQNRGASGSELAKARREAVRPYLYGIKVALEYEIPDERVGIPGFEVEHYDGPDLEEHKRIAEEDEKHAAQLKKARFINDMVFRRDGCVGQIVSLYSKKPFATDELRQIATEILEDTDAVNKLISKVDAAVKKRLQKELGKISEEVLAEATTGTLKDATSQKSPLPVAGEESLELFNKEIQLAEKAPHRDAKVEHLRKALSYRANHPDNIVIEYRIGLLLGQTTDPAYNQGTRPREALAIFESIVERYDHMHYYEMEGQDSIDSPQAMVPRAHIQAANLIMILDRDWAKAREHLWRAMECMKQTYEERKEDWQEWLKLPPPPKPREDSPFGGPREMSKWKFRMHWWEKQRRDVIEGNLFSRHEMHYVEVAVRQYGYDFAPRPHKPEMVPVYMNDIIRDFPDTPMARIAQEHIDRISETVGEEKPEDEQTINEPKSEMLEEYSKYTHPIEITAAKRTSRIIRVLEAESLRDSFDNLGHVSFFYYPGHYSQWVEGPFDIIHRILSNRRVCKLYDELRTLAPQERHAYLKHYLDFYIEEYRKIYEGYRVKEGGPTTDYSELILIGSDDFEEDHPPTFNGTKLAVQSLVLLIGLLGDHESLPDLKRLFRNPILGTEFEEIGFEEVPVRHFKRYPLLPAEIQAQALFLLSRHPESSASPELENVRKVIGRVVKDDMVNSIRILNYRSRVTPYDVLHTFLGEAIDTSYGATEVTFLSTPHYWEFDIHSQIADAFLTSP